MQSGSLSSDQTLGSLSCQCSGGHCST